MQLREKIDLLILGAVPFEVERLHGSIESSEFLEVLGETFCLGRYGSVSVLIGATGLGKVNAAIVTSALLTRFAVGQVWNIGCAGAFREGPLGPGDMLISDRLILGDEGILTRDDVLSTRHIGIPVVRRRNQSLYDCIPLDQNLLMDKLRGKFPEGAYGEGRESFKLFYGPSLCVGMASGDAEVASKRFKRYAAFAENMEGSAVAQACFRFDVPMVECRGISNVVGNRCKKDWCLGKAITNCHQVVLLWIDHLDSTSEFYQRNI